MACGYADSFERKVASSRSAVAMRRSLATEVATVSPESRAALAAAMRLSNSPGAAAADFVALAGCVPSGLWVGDWAKMKPETRLPSRDTASQRLLLRLVS